MLKSESAQLFTYDENSWIYTFAKSISDMWKCQQSHPGFELVSPYLFPTITITPRAPFKSTF